MCFQLLVAFVNLLPVAVPVPDPGLAPAKNPLGAAATPRTSTCASQINFHDVRPKYAPGGFHETNRANLHSTKHEEPPLPTVSLHTTPTPHSTMIHLRNRLWRTLIICDLLLLPSTLLATNPHRLRRSNLNRSVATTITDRRQGPQ